MSLGLLKHGLPFAKMHGAGNDFVVIDSRRGEMMMVPALARALADRHRGIGFDQLAEIGPQDADGSYGLNFWNGDGSVAGACGNATRCVADRLMRELNAQNVVLKSQRGRLEARRLENGDVQVNMGPPQLHWHEIPLSHEVDTLHLPLPGDLAGIGMGNPHCVIFVPDADAVDPAQLGPAYESAPLFPQRSNVEFISLKSPNHLRLRVWERGTGVTLACGSGACAAAVAAHLRGMTGRDVLLDLDGGPLSVSWRDDGVWLSGPVAYVFEGHLSADFLAEHL